MIIGFSISARFNYRGCTVAVESIFQPNANFAFNRDEADIETCAIMKVCFIVNPGSGRLRKDPSVGRAISSFMAECEWDTRLEYTQRAGHATELSRLAAGEGCDLVVAVGGDGTLNEVGQGLLGRETVLGILPCGTGNGLARHLGIPTRANLALDVLRKGTVRRIDTGEANGLRFLNVMGLGFDAEVSRGFKDLRRRSFLAYLRVSLAAYFRLAPERLEIICGNRSITVDAWMLTIANSDQFGTSARIAPGACVDDGILNLTCIRSNNLLSATLLAVRLFMGNIDRSPLVSCLTGASFEVVRERPGLIHTDGEPFETEKRIAVNVDPKSLAVIVP